MCCRDKDFKEKKDSLKQTINSINRTFLTRDKDFKENKDRLC